MLYIKAADGSLAEAHLVHIQQFVGSALYKDAAGKTPATLTEAQAELDVPLATSKDFVDGIIAGSTALAGKTPKALTNVVAQGIAIEAATEGLGCVIVSLPTDTATGDARVALRTLADKMMAQGGVRVGTTDPLKVKWREAKVAAALGDYDEHFA